MKPDPRPPADIDAYIAGFPPAVQRVLQQVRATIAAAAPGARETIKYRLPTFVQDGILVHFGAFKTHIGLYALPTAHAKFQRELAGYRSGKGSVQFPLDQPMPLALITRMVQFRVREDRRTR